VLENSKLELKVYSIIYKWYFVIGSVLVSNRVLLGWGVAGHHLLKALFSLTIDKKHTTDTTRV